MCVFSGPTEAALRRGDISVALEALIDDILEGNGQPAIGVSLSAIRSNIGMTASCSSELTAVALVSFMLPLLPESDPR